MFIVLKGSINHRDFCFQEKYFSVKKEKKKKTAQEFIFKKFTVINFHTCFKKLLLSYIVSKQSKILERPTSMDW